MKETSFPKKKIKVLLLENIHPNAVQSLESDGLSVELVSGALDEDTLCDRISDVHLLGIRSKTQVSERVLASARRLLSVGCFCIGVNQVDLRAARERGVVVFNAPFSNTRSVAELVISHVIALARQIGDRSAAMHQGQWNKSALGSFEIRGKTLGIVGYGHIGRQVGVLAEAMGLNVLFFDNVKKLPMGNNRSVDSLEVLFQRSDFVTLHVPATAQTAYMIGEAELGQMGNGACLLNLSRGNVVEIDPLAKALRSGHLAGAAIDVFPKEPKTNQEPFESALRGLKNVILTPHIGGSTEEAQAAIGLEVSDALLRFLNAGSTASAVGFPTIDPPPLGSRHRILNIHKNQPGVLSQINTIISELNANVESQVLATDSSVGYLVMDLDRDVSSEVYARVSALETNIRTRILF